MNTTSITEVYAFIDESGAKGLVRNLTEDRDKEIALAAAVLIPSSTFQVVHSKLEVPYNDLKVVTPVDKKLHITDAFASANEIWIKAAKQTRKDIKDILIKNDIHVIYAARRLGISRQTFAMTQGIIDSAREFQRTRSHNIRINNHPSDDRVETEVFGYLFLKLDAYGKDLSQFIVPHIDHTTDAVYKQYFTHLEHARQLAQNTSTHSAFDLSTQRVVRGQIGFTVHLGDGQPAIQLNTTHVKDPTVHEDVTPEILAADVVANDLLFHLKQLVAPLNVESSIRGWDLSQLIKAVVPHDNFDLF